MDTINIVQQNGVGKGRPSGSDYSTFDEKTCNTEQELVRNKARSTATEASVMNIYTITKKKVTNIISDDVDRKYRNNNTNNDSTPPILPTVVSLDEFQDLVAARAFFRASAINLSKQDAHFEQWTWIIFLSNSN